jgi:formate dehydrogenase maturation protein FdhE
MVGNSYDESEYEQVTNEMGYETADEYGAQYFEVNSNDTQKTQKQFADFLRFVSQIKDEDEVVLELAPVKQDSTTSLSKSSKRGVVPVDEIPMPT